MADDKLAIPALPTAGREYEQHNEHAFRREVQNIMYEVDAALSRFADTVSSGLIPHAPSHDAGGTDPLDSYYSQVGHSHTESDISDLVHYVDADADARIAAAALEDLGDVDAYSSLASGELLKWSGTGWVHNTLAEAGVSATGHTHVEANITDLQAYLLNITGESVGDLSDVTVTAGTNGDVLVADTGVWVDKSLSEAGIAAASHTHVEADITDLQSYLLNITGESLSDLSDVTITAIASGEILKWNGAAWINNTLAEAGISAPGHTHTESDITDLAHYVDADADARIALANLDDLADVIVAGATNNDVLVKTALGWEDLSLAAAGIAAASHTHPTSDIVSGTFADALVAQSNVTQHQAALSITESQISDLSHSVATLNAIGNVTITANSAGEILKWSGTAWINNTLAEAGISAAGHTHTVSEVTDFDPTDYLPLTAGSGQELSGSLYIDADSSFVYLNGTTAGSSGISFRDKADDDRFAVFYREGTTYDIVLEAFGAPADNSSNGDIFRCDTETLLVTFGANIDVTGDLDVSGGNITIGSGHEIDGSSASYLDLESLESARILLDSNNNSTATLFGVYNDTYSDELFRISETITYLLGASYSSGTQVAEAWSAADTKLILRDSLTNGGNYLDFYGTSTRRAYIGTDPTNMDFYMENLTASADIRLEVNAGGIYVNDGGASSGRVASIANLTTSTTAPSSSAYPYGAIWGIY